MKKVFRSSSSSSFFVILVIMHFGVFGIIEWVCTRELVELCVEMTGEAGNDPVMGSEPMTDVVCCTIAGMTL
jgi:hypothetical protein